MRIGLRGEACPYLSKHLVREVDESRQVVPIRMTGNARFQISPDTFNQVELRAIGWKPQWHNLIRMIRQPLPNRRRFVIRRIIEYQHNLVMREYRDTPLEQREEGGRIATGSDDLHHASTGVVKRTKDGGTPVYSCSVDPESLSWTLPGLCQRGVGVQVTLIGIEETESGARSPLFCSVASTCAALATASASCR